jgi:hypothetical protein
MISECFLHKIELWYLLVDFADGADLRIVVCNNKIHVSNLFLRKSMKFAGQKIILQDHNHYRPKDDSVRYALKPSNYL